MDLAEFILSKNKFDVLTFKMMSKDLEKDPERP